MPIDFRKDYGKINLDKHTCKYTWVIHEYELKFLSLQDKIKSPKFGTTFNDKVFDWQIWLYPKGAKGVTNGAIAIAVYNFSVNTIIADASFGFVNNENMLVNVKVTNRKAYNTKKHSEATWMIADFAKSDILSKDNDLIHDFHKVIIECEINLYTSDTKGRRKLEDIAEENEQMLRFQEFDKYERLINESVYSDISFVIENNRLKAHKCILSSSSPVFAAMFQREMKERQENIVVIKDLKFNVFVEMLRYIYAGKINLELDDVKSTSELLIAADRYSIDGLKRMCIKLIYKQMSIDNAVEILVFADFHQLDCLKNRAIHLIVLHSDELENVSDFKALISTPDILYEVCHAIAGKARLLF